MLFSGVGVCGAYVLALGSEWVVCCAVFVWAFSVVLCSVRYLGLGVDGCLGLWWVAGCGGLRVVVG